MSGIDSDRQARLEALDPGRSFIVQAPAGSGKTELLTQRVLVLLARVESPERIVALTFTRKAAAEMRHRITAALARAADETPPESEHARHTWTLARAARANAIARDWQLEQAPQRLQISTIDAWCSSLVRRSPLLSETGGLLRIADEPASLYREAARRTLAVLEASGPATEALREVLIHLDHRSDRVQAFLITLLAGRDRWRGIIGSAGPDAQTRAHMQAQIAALVEAATESAMAQLPESLRLQWWASASYAARHLPAEHPLHAALTLGRLPTQASECMHWQPLCELLLTKAGSIRSTVTKNQGFPSRKDGGDDGMKAAHLALLESLADIPDVGFALKTLTRLPVPVYEDRQWSVLLALLRILGRAMAELQLLFAETGTVDHTEVTLRALQALGTEEVPTDLLLKLDDRLEHLLVDEFQDTSDTQMQLLRLLTVGWSPGDGRSLFLVGDPMQSIYRFRNANVGLFLRARDEGIGELSLDMLQLQRNFRSQAGIVDWVNRVFPKVLAEENLQRGAVRYAEAVAHHPAETEAVQWHITDEAAEAEAIVALCHALPAGERVAVLVRGRSHLRAIVPALRQSGLRFRAIEVEGLAERQVIQDLRALTRALCQPADRISWLALLRAPWCGLRLQDLKLLTSDLDRHSPLWSQLRHPGLPLALSADGRERLARILPALHHAMDSIGRQPLRARVETLWVALGGPACVESDADLKDAEAFLGLLERLSQGGAWVDLAALDRSLEELRAAADPNAGEGIQLMTMHKAKGLQFEHVILPGLTRKPPPNRKPVIVQSTAIDDWGREIPLLAPIHAAETDGDPLFEFLGSHMESVRDEAETGRLLYVAATRAIRRLHLFADLRRSNGSDIKPLQGLMKRLWPGVEDDVTPLCPPVEAPAEEALSASPTPITAPPLRRLAADWAPPAPGISLPSPASARDAGTPAPFDWAGEAARVTGVLYHRWMQQIAGDATQDWTDARIDSLRPTLLGAAASAGLTARRGAEVAERVIDTLQQTLRDPQGRWLLAPHAAGHWSEYALCSMVDGRLRRYIIDRTFIDDEGTRWIVDFKTGRHEGGALDTFLAQERERYAPQLQGYARLLASEGRPIRLALYYPALPEGQRLITLD
jgi:ATP-dependent helicase/nuclease subunit A